MQRIGYYRKSGELFLQNISLKKLADDYGTPTFIYDSNLIDLCPIQTAIHLSRSKMLHERFLACWNLYSLYIERLILMGLKIKI